MTSTYLNKLENFFMNPEIMDACLLYPKQEVDVLLKHAKQEIEQLLKEQADTLNALHRIEEKADTLLHNRKAYVQQWRLAHAAFRGAFDTAVMRRKQDDDYSDDARIRINGFDATLRSLYPTLFQEPL